MKYSSAKQQYRRVAISLFVLSFLVIQGCGSGKKGITIDSDPQGANVVADGKNIGITPVHIKQDEVFPPHWYGSSYKVKGKLEISKDGCEGFNMEVNDLVLSKDIKANLKCKPGAVQPMSEPAPVSEKMETKKAKPVSATPAPVPVKAEPSKPALDEGIEQRLAKLKSLRDRGVITADEYSAQRKRILDSL